MPSWRSWWWLGVAVLAAVGLAPSAPGLRPADAQTGAAVVLGLDQEPPTLDPHASPSAVTYQIIASVTESLLYRGPDGKLAPSLAESWSPSRDGRSVTFKLRRDIKVHDGTPFAMYESFFATLSPSCSSARASAVRRSAHGRLEVY